MGEFFNGWRRKISVVTLVMAVFSASCARTVRSRSQDTIPLRAISEEEGPSEERRNDRQSNENEVSKPSNSLREIAAKHLRVGMALEEVNAALIDQEGLTLLSVDRSGGESRLSYGRGMDDKFRKPWILVRVRSSRVVGWEGGFEIEDLQQELIPE